MRLKFYEPSDYSLVEQYMLSQVQLLYTMSPMASLKLSETDINRHAILAMKGEKLVTFFVLHENEGVKPYSENNQAILIRGFSTDMHEQGKGYAKEALQLLPTFVRLHFPTINELVLGVNVPNTAAQALYKTCGFIDEGICAVGIKSELKVMSYDLQSDH